MSPQEGAVRDGDGVDYSTTNVQEEGVDEPDIVKTDGRRLYVMAESTLHVFDIRSGRAEARRLADAEGIRPRAARVRRPGARPDDVLGRPRARSRKPRASPDVRAGARIRIPEPATRLFEIDVSDPAAPKLLNTLTVEGYYVSARLRGSVARVVIATPPSPWPVEYESGQTQEEAEADQRKAIRRTRLSTWMPDAVLRDRVRDKRRRPRVVQCDDVRRPTRYSGPGMLTVLTVGFDRGLKPIDSDSLMTDAQTIYASKRSLFVATEKWFDPAVSDPNQEVDAGRFTAIHRFAIDDPESADYRASGEVPRIRAEPVLAVGARRLLAGGDDRPAAMARERGAARERELRDASSARSCIEVGRVGGLGRGERIFAVRFLGEKGYVVTFRQIDPLYTLDLSDPQNPRVRGELKILGFSSYLHPIGNDLLLGLGQDANEQGQTPGHAALAVRRLRPERAEAARTSTRSASRPARQPSTTTTRSCTGRRRSWPSSRSAPTSRRTRSTARSGSASSATTGSARSAAPSTRAGTSSAPWSRMAACSRCPTAACCRALSTRSSRSASPVSKVSTPLEKVVRRALSAGPGRRGRRARRRGAGAAAGARPSA